MHFLLVDGIGDELTAVNFNIWRLDDNQLVRIVYAMLVHPASFVMSTASVETVSIRLYQMAFQGWDTGRASALAYIVLIVVLAITNIYVKYLNRVKER